MAKRARGNSPQSTGGKMKFRNLVKFLLIITVYLMSSPASAFFYAQEDKNLHLATSMTMTFAFTSALMLTYPQIGSRKAALIAAAATLLIGAAKESFYDDKFDWEDMGANAVGVSMGSVPFIVIEF